MLRSLAKQERPTKWEKKSVVMSVFRILQSEKSHKCDFNVHFQDKIYIRSGETGVHPHLFRVWGPLKGLHRFTGTTVT